MKEQWKNDLKEKLADYRQPAPELSWTDVEKAIEKETNLNRHATRLLRMKRAAAAAALLLLAGGASYIAFHSGSTPKTLQPHDLTTSKSIQNPIITEPEAATQPPSFSVRRPSVTDYRPSPIAYITTVTGGTSPTPQPATSDSQLPASGSSPTTATTTSPLSEKKKKTEEERRQSATVYHPTYGIRRTASDARLTAQVYMSNSMIRLSQKQTGNAMFASAKPYGSSRENDDKTTPSCFIKNMDANVNNSIRHHQPIRIGASVSYQLTDRWSIGTGVSYSYLSTDIDGSRNESNRHTDQKLIYVGIPVTASYRIAGNRHFNVYTSGGVMGEKMVKGRATTKTYVGNQQILQNTEKVKIRPLQWSVNGSVGAEYKLGGRLSVYAEPGVSCYFDNNSDVPTIYKDKPVNFNLNIGVRFNIK